MLSAAIFDMDGLMFNTEDLYDIVCGELLGRRGQKFTLDLKLKMMGLTAEPAWEMLRQTTGVTTPWRELQAESDVLFEELLPSRLVKLPGLDWLLSELAHRDIATAVATSSRRKFAERAIRQAGLIDQFEFILTGDDVACGKPHPEIYWRAAAKIGASPNQMIVFEDSPNGSRAAVAAGAITVAVPGKHSCQSDFSHVHLLAESLDSPSILALIEERSEN